MRLVILHFPFLGPLTDNAKVPTRMRSNNAGENAAPKVVVDKRNGGDICFAHGRLAEGIDTVIYKVHSGWILISSIFYKRELRARHTHPYAAIAECYGSPFHSYGTPTSPDIRQDTDSCEAY